MENLKIFHIYRTDKVYYDEHDSCVLIAEDVDEARTLHGLESDEIVIEEIGISKEGSEKGTVVASFNAE